MNKILLFFIIFSISILPFIGFAANHMDLKIGSGSGSTASCPSGVDCPIKNISDVMTVLTSVAKIMYQAFFIVAIIFIILAAFNYLTAGDDAEKIKSASKQIMLAAVAIAVVLMAFGFSTLIKNFIGT